jgi:hypothetical protein
MIHIHDNLLCIRDDYAHLNHALCVSHSQFSMSGPFFADMILTRVKFRLYDCRKHGQVQGITSTIALTRERICLLFRDLYSNSAVPLTGRGRIRRDA